MQYVIENYGEPGWDRTFDPLIKSLLLRALIGPPQPSYALFLLCFLRRFTSSPLENPQQSRFTYGSQIPSTRFANAMASTGK